MTRGLMRIGWALAVAGSTAVPGGAGTEDRAADRSLRQVVVVVRSSTGAPVAGARVFLMDTRGPGRQVASAWSNGSGTVRFGLDRERRRALAELAERGQAEPEASPILDVPYMVAAVTADGELATYSFSRSYADTAELERREQLSPSEAAARAYHVIEAPLLTEVALRTEPTGRKTPNGPPVTIASCLTAKRRSDTDDGNRSVRVAEVHAGGLSLSGSTATFKYEAGAGNELEVAKTVNGGSTWSADGTVTVRNDSGFAVTWPAEADSDYYARTQFHFHREYWRMLCEGGFVAEWDKIKADRYDGGTGWERQPIDGDWASTSGIEAGQYGAWASYLPGSRAERYEQNGYTLGGAFTVFGFSFKTKVKFDQKKTHIYDFGRTYMTKFYLYDRNVSPSPWAVLYVSGR